MNTTSIQDLIPDGFGGGGGGLTGNGGGPVSGGGGRLSEPIVVEKGKGELPNVSYEPLNVHPNPYLHGMTEMPQIVPPNSLPSRDIPQNTLQYSQDEATLPNYIPAPSNRRPKNYVEEVSDDQIEHFRRKKYRKRIFEDIWEQLQIPILVSLLYFILNMSFLDKLFYSTFQKFLPMLFSDTTGLLTVYGLAMKAFLFGLAYTGMMALVQIV